MCACVCVYVHVWGEGGLWVVYMWYLGAGGWVSECGPGHLI